MKTSKVARGSFTKHAWSVVRQPRTVRMFILAVTLAIASAYWLTGARANTATVPVEAEQGTVAGNAFVTNQTGASDGKAVTFTAATPSQPRPDSLKAYNFSIDVNGTAQTLEYFSNADISKPDTSIQHIVFVLHGTSRNANDYGDRAYSQAKKAGADPTRETLVIAPHFLSDEDVSGSTTKLYWTNDGWKAGEQSLNTAWKMSSYEVLDRMVLQLKQSYPRMNAVGFIGHSAGGQVLHRYAAGTSIPEQLEGVDMRYAIANPSSYLYFDKRRPQSGGSFAEPSGSSCSEFNDYKYGMEGMPPYMTAAGAQNIPEQYKKHRVYILLGEKDTYDDGSMDMDCPAMLQGAHRFARGSNYYAYEAAYFGAPLPNHYKMVVPGVDHDGDAMINSSQAIEALYGP